MHAGRRRDSRAAVEGGKKRERPRGPPRRLPQRRLVSSFESKLDLIECLLSATHVPIFMDLNLFHKHNDELSIDAAMTMQSEEELFVGDEDDVVYIDHNEDESLRSKATASGPLSNFDLRMGADLNESGSTNAGTRDFMDLAGHYDDEKGASNEKYERFSASFASLVRLGYMYGERLDRDGMLESLPRRT